MCSSAVGGYALAVDEQQRIESLKAELQSAYRRLRSMSLGTDTSEAHQEIERLERDLLDCYAAFVEKRDSSRPPKAMG